MVEVRCNSKLGSNTAAENWQLCPVRNFPGSFEHEHDDEHEDDWVAAPLLCASVVNPLSRQQCSAIVFRKAGTYFSARNLVFLRGFYREELCLPDQSCSCSSSCSCSGSYQPHLIILDGRNERERRSNSQNEELSRGRTSRWASVQRLETWLAGRGDVARSASPQDRWPTKQAERSALKPGPVDATALRARARARGRARGRFGCGSAALRLCGESPSPVSNVPRSSLEKPVHIFRL